MQENFTQASAEISKAKDYQDHTDLDGRNILKSISEKWA
jgi:hypothetical protein